MPEEQLTLKLLAEDDFTPAINSARAALEGLDSAASRIALDLQRAFELNIGEITEKEFNRVRDQLVLTGAAAMKVGQQMSLALESPISAIKATNDELVRLGRGITKAFSEFTGARPEQLRTMLGNPQDVAALEAYEIRLRRVDDVLKDIATFRPPPTIEERGEKLYGAIERDPSKKEIVSSEQLAALEAYSVAGAKAAAETEELEGVMQDLRKGVEQDTIAFEDLDQMIKATNFERLAVQEREATIAAEQAAQVYRQLGIEISRLSEIESTSSQRRGGYGRHGLGGFIPQAIEGFKTGGVSEAVKSGVSGFAQGAMQMASWMIEWRALQAVFDGVTATIGAVVQQYQQAVHWSNILGASNSQLASTFSGINLAALMTGQSVEDTNKRVTQLYSVGFSADEAVKNTTIINEKIRDTGVDLTDVVVHAHEFSSTIEDLQKMGTAGHPEMLPVAQEMKRAEALKGVQQLNTQIREQAESEAFQLETRHIERAMQDRNLAVNRRIEDEHRVATLAMEETHRNINYEREDRHRLINEEIQDRHRVQSQAEQDVDRLHNRQVGVAQGIKGLTSAAMVSMGIGLPAGAEAPNLMPGLEKAQAVLKQDLQRGMAQLQKDLGISPETSRQLLSTGMMAPSELISEARAAKEEERIQEQRAREMESLKTERAEAKEDREEGRRQALETLNLVVGQQKESRIESRKQQDNQLAMTRHIQDTEFEMQHRNQLNRIEFENWYLQQRLKIVTIIEDAELKALQEQADAEAKLHGKPAPSGLERARVYGEEPAPFTSEVQEVTNVLTEMRNKASLPGEPGGTADVKRAADSLQKSVESYAGIPKTAELQAETQKNTDATRKNTEAVNSSTKDINTTANVSVTATKENTDATKANTQVVNKVTTAVGAAAVWGTESAGGTPAQFGQSKEAQFLWQQHLENLSKIGMQPIGDTGSRNFTAVNPTSSAAFRARVGGPTDAELRQIYYPENWEKGSVGFAGSPGGMWGPRGYSWDTSGLYGGAGGASGAKESGLQGATNANTEATKANTQAIQRATETPEKGLYRPVKDAGTGSHLPLRPSSEQEHRVPLLLRRPSSGQEPRMPSGGWVFSEDKRFPVGTVGGPAAPLPSMPHGGWPVGTVGGPKPMESHVMPPGGWPVGTVGGPKPMMGHEMPHGGWPVGTVGGPKPTVYPMPSQTRSQDQQTGGSNSGLKEISKKLDEVIEHTRVTASAFK